MFNNLKELRVSLGLTQEEFGRSLGLAKTTYHNYETGLREPRSDFWSFVSKKYDVTIDYLLGLSPDPHTYSDGTIKGPRFNVTYMERSYLSKVRALDDSGRALVKMVIDHEHDRCSAPAEEAASADDDSNVVNLTGLFPHLGLASAGPGALAQDAPVDWEQRSHAPRGATATMTIKGHSMEPLYHDGDLIWVDTTRPAEEGEIGVFAVDGQTYCKRLRYVDGRAVLESINPACGNITVTQDDARQIGRVVQK